MNRHFYMAYGMNTDPQAMAFRTGEPLAIGRGLVRDHAFRFACHADVYPCPGTDIHGVLWDLDDEQLAALDAREGFPLYYDRKMVVVECGGRSYEAWMYFMAEAHPVEPPSDHYYGMLDRGYGTFRVPKHQIVDALAHSVVTAARRAGQC